LVAFAVVVVFVMGVDNAVVNVADMMSSISCIKERKRKGKEKMLQFISSNN